MGHVITRVINYVCAAAFAVAATSLLAGIVVLAANDQSPPRDYGNGPGMALVMILKG